MSPTGGRRPSEEMLSAVRRVSPGTALREGINNILRARTGALIVVGAGEQVLDLVSGGFKLDIPLRPSYIYELAKMDGAIILSRDGRRILRANVQLLPDPAIPSTETGIRHRTASRMAKQTGELVIAISRNRNMVTLYQGTKRYVLRDASLILAKAGQAVQTLDRYRSALDDSLWDLTSLEFRDLVTLGDVVTVMQRIGMVSTVAGEIEGYVWELGAEGRLVRLQLEELVGGVEDEGRLVARDYSKQHLDPCFDLEGLLPDNLADPAAVARSLGYEGTAGSLEAGVAPRGYRILSKIPQLPRSVVEKVVDKFHSLQAVLRTEPEELIAVDGIGEARAKNIDEGLRRLREQSVVFGRRGPRFPFKLSSVRRS